MKQINDETLYEAIDLQGAGFASDRQLTIEGWREQALEWCDMDDNDELAEYIKSLPERFVLSEISSYWSLEFIKVKGGK